MTAEFVAKEAEAVLGRIVYLKFAAYAALNQTAIVHQTVLHWHHVIGLAVDYECRRCVGIYPLFKAVMLLEGRVLLLACDKYVGRIAAAVVPILLCAKKIAASAGFNVFSLKSDEG